ncbi:MAG: flagellar basal body protein [Candidatus Saganbacteria bacterium]|nr:flagellar basal body protein [Candidatus Saganbacteria bacterium]
MADNRQIQRIEAFDSDFSKLEEAMQRSTKTHAIIAHNIANANTPGYEALKFDEVLDEAVKRTEKPQVDLEEEMAALGHNGLRYSSYVKLLSSKINVLKTIVTQGRK